jgi:hypothetical protein
MSEDLKQELYRIVDHFLTEAKNQNGEERSLERLNADRHLAVENLEALFVKQQEENQKIIDGIFEIKERELARQREEFVKIVDVAIAGYIGRNELEPTTEDEAVIHALLDIKSKLNI